jgi:hypothetical protein
MTEWRDSDFLPPLSRWETSSSGNGRRMSRISSPRKSSCTEQICQPVSEQWRLRQGVGIQSWLWTDSSGPPKQQWTSHQETAAQAMDSGIWGREDRQGSATWQLTLSKYPFVHSFIHVYYYQAFLCPGGSGRHHGLSIWQPQPHRATEHKKCS